MFLDPGGEDWLFDVQRRLIDPAARTRIHQLGLIFLDIIQVAEAIADLRADDGQVPSPTEVERSTGCPLDIVRTTFGLLVELGFLDNHDHIIDVLSNQPLRTDVKKRP